MKKFNNWFNKTFGWFFTNGGKTQRQHSPSKITKVEIIDVTLGKTYVNINVQTLEMSYQDDGKTLKIFIK